MAEGLEERKAEKLDNEAAEGEAAAAPRRERRAYAATTLPPLKAKKLLPKKLP